MSRLSWRAKVELKIFVIYPSFRINGLIHDNFYHAFLDEEEFKKIVPDVIRLIKCLDGVLGDKLGKVEEKFTAQTHYEEPRHEENGLWPREFWPEE